MTAWTDKFMAIPFVDGGRSRAGADCFGLYAIVVRDLFAVQLDQDVSYERDADAVVRRVADEVASDRWITIACFTEAEWEEWETSVELLRG